MSGENGEDVVVGIAMDIGTTFCLCRLTAFRSALTAADVNVIRESDCDKQQRQERPACLFVT